MAEKSRVIIVGAGFGGIKLARTLAKNPQVSITIVDRVNFHLFQPLLYQVSTAILDPQEIAYPIRAFFRKQPNVDFFMAHATGIDKKKKLLQTDHGDLPYDYLVLAAGSTTNCFGLKSVEENSYPMKTLREALHIRNHVLHMFERAAREPDEQKRRRMLSFVVVGGGPTGIEEAGSLSELFFSVMRGEYHHLNFDEVSLRLIEATDKVLPVMPPDLREETLRVLRKKHVNVMLKAQVADCDSESLTLKDGTVIPTNTVIWAAGVKAVPFVAQLGFQTDRAGRVVVNEKLQVEGERDIFAIGDCASFCHGTERPLPTIAPVSTQGALVCARNLQKLMAGDENLETFVYKDLGAMATIGRGAAVVARGKMKLTGFIAWSAWLIVHLMRLAGFHTNVTVSLKWFWNFLSGTRLGRIITNSD